MQNLIKDKISLLIGVGILILILITVGVFLFYKPANKTTQKNTQPFQVKTETLANGETAKAFPESLPIEPGSKILQNYQSTANDGRVQFTKQFTSNLSVEAAVKKYTEFFKSSGWTAPSTIKSPVVLLKKAETAMIVVNKGTGEANSVVEVTLLQKK